MVGGMQMAGRPLATRSWTPRTEMSLGRRWPWRQEVQCWPGRTAKKPRLQRWRVLKAAQGTDDQTSIDVLTDGDDPSSTRTRPNQIQSDRESDSQLGRGRECAVVPEADEVRWRRSETEGLSLSAEKTGC